MLPDRTEGINPRPYVMLSSALTATQKEVSTTPQLLRFLISLFLRIRNFATRKQHLLRNGGIFFPKAFPPCNMMLQRTKAEKNGDDKTTLYPAARSWRFMTESPES